MFTGPLWRLCVRCTDLLSPVALTPVPMDVDKGDGEKEPLHLKVAAPEAMKSWNVKVQSSPVLDAAMVDDEEEEA
jgi:hypothetical protein